MPRLRTRAPRGPAHRGVRPGPGSGLPEQHRADPPREGVRRRDPTLQRPDLEGVTGSRLRSTDEGTRSTDEGTRSTDEGTRSTDDDSRSTGTSGHGDDR